MKLHQSSDWLNLVLSKIGEIDSEFANKYLSIDSNLNIDFIAIDNTLFKRSDWVQESFYPYPDGGSFYYFDSTDSKIYIWILVNSKSKICEVEFFEPTGKNILPIKDEIRKIFFEIYG